MNSIEDAREFFQQSAGQWRSQRTTHHLPFRRAESGSSQINVEFLDASDERIAEICQMHDEEPQNAIGGAFVSWDGSMAWDKENEDHKGTTVFALIPEGENLRKGKLLRERGYAEIVPVIGRYEMDSEDGLVLTTDYETMSSVERFWFPSPNLRVRTSVVKRFGGLSTASFCAESRVETVPEQNKDDAEARKAFEVASQYSSFGW